MNGNVSLLQVAKDAGYSTVKEFSEACGRSERTLFNWRKQYPVCFAAIVRGVSKKVI